MLTAVGSAKTAVRNHAAVAPDRLRLRHGSVMSELAMIPPERSRRTIPAFQEALRPNRVDSSLWITVGRASERPAPLPRLCPPVRAPLVRVACGGRPPSARGARRGPASPPSSPPPPPPPPSSFPLPPAAPPPARH